MPSAARQGDISTGHNCFHPTACVNATTSKVYINGKLAQKKGSIYLLHRCGKTIHTNRLSNSGSAKVFYEGLNAIRIGDSINCGDSVGQGSNNVIVGG
jgi:uncharacterized Zn-binding protein involved in type VI secretion